MSKLESFLPLVEPQALVRTASPKALKAGQDLHKAGAVSDLVFEGEAVSGKVKGTHAQPHVATLKIGPKGGLEAQCSCPTYTDGWEKVCHHAVALGLALSEHYRKGADIATTQNPWVIDVDDGSGGSQRRYVLMERGGSWYVSVFQAGAAVVQKRRGSREGLSPADRMIQHYLDQELERTEDGSHELDEPAVAGLLYFARFGQVSLKNVGKLKFVAEPLVMRVRAETRKDAAVELHGFLEHVGTGRTFELDQGKVIAGAPTWFIVAESCEIFPILDTPPWVLEAVAKQSRIVMDARMGAEQMDSLSTRLQSVGVPRHDLFALATDARQVEKIIATIEGDARRIKVALAASYGARLRLLYVLSPFPIVAPAADLPIDSRVWLSLEAQGREKTVHPIGGVGYEASHWAPSKCIIQACLLHTTRWIRPQSLAPAWGFLWWSRRLRQQPSRSPSRARYRPQPRASTT